MIRDNTISTTVTNAEINLSQWHRYNRITSRYKRYRKFTSGNITFDGNLVFGDTGDDSTRLADTVELNADIHSDIVPDVHETYNLGANYSNGIILNLQQVMLQLY